LPIRPATRRQPLLRRSRKVFGRPQQIGEAETASPHQKAKALPAGGYHPMRSIAFADFLIGVGILFVLEGLMFAASPAWMRRAMKSALATPDNILRAVGIGSAVAGLILIWFVRR
jgi:uncharacterized protein YjeT (DUF2065 family)